MELRRSILWCIVAVAVCGSLAGATSREQLLREVAERARLHAEANRPHESAQDLSLAFASDAAAAGVSFREVQKTYEDTYAATMAKLPWWRKQRPAAGWIIAAVMFLALVFRDAVKSAGEALVKRVGNAAYNRMAGLRWLRRIALKRYRTAIRRKYAKVVIPFRTDLVLEMHDTYVPLKLRGRNDVDHISIESVLHTASRALVLGAPGSGKSMLLRSVALAYADRTMRLPNDAVPILVELNRLSEGTPDLLAQLADAFDRAGFPHARNFVERALRDGYLLVLLDGFDEVSSDRRNGVAAHVRDVIERFPNARFVITCRTAVYRGEFDAHAESSLEVVELSDQQVMAFLKPWQLYMPAEKSIDQLLQTLRDRPPIMLLARNPLLLTIIAFLYTDTEFILPHSRAEFYDQAVDVLLRQWKNTQNAYKAPHKRLVLEHLALHNQLAMGNDHDRRTIDHATLLREVNAVLPHLNLEPKDATPLLDEIVERSGLMMYIDGGQRCQFVHLTLQEFFAASALAGDPARLLELFQADRDGWREVVKLWCGLEHDSTQFIQSIRAGDRVMALECLADAQKIDPEFADGLMREFSARFSWGGDIDESIIRAFAAVASDSRPRGAAAFEFLQSLATTDSRPEVRLTAASALSMTNLSQAAAILADLFLEDLAIGPLMVRMGDLSVDVAVERLATRAPDAAAHILSLVGTPKAIRALARMLFHEGADEAALLLGAKFSEASTIEALLQFEPTPAEARARWIPWAWTPFDDGRNKSVRLVAGRIVELLVGLFEKGRELEHEVIDSRLVVAACLELNYRRPAKPNSDTLDRVVLRALQLVPQESRAKVRRALDDNPTIQNWELHRKPVRKFALRGSVEHWCLVGIYALVATAAMITIVQRVGGATTFAKAVWPAVCGLSIIGVFLALVFLLFTKEPEGLYELLLAAVAPVALVVGLVLAFIAFETDDDRTLGSAWMIAGLSALATPGCIGWFWYASALFTTRLHGGGFPWAWVAVAVAVVTVLITAVVREVDDNPFRHLAPLFAAR